MVWSYNSGVWWTVRRSRQAHTAHHCTHESRGSVSLRIRFFNIVEVVNTFFRDLPAYLGDRGADVEIHVSSAQYREGREPLHEAIQHPRVQVRYVNVGTNYKTSALRRVWVYVHYIGTVMRRTLFGPTADVNFFLTQPPLFSLWGLILQRVRRQPYIVLIMDLYPEVVAAHGSLSQDGLLYRVLQWLSIRSLKGSSKVVVIGRCMRDRLVAEGVAAEKVAVIPNWINEQVIYPIDHAENALRQELGLEDAFVILYSGNMGVAHTFDDILEVAHRLRDLPDLRFVFIGTGSRRHEIEQAIATHGLDNVLLLPFQPLDQLAYSQSLGDVHFVSLRAGFEGLVVPSKTYGAFAARRPVIYQGDLRGEIARVIAEEQIGAVIEPSQPDEMEAIVRRYYADRDLARLQGERAYELSRTRLSREQSLQRYQTIIDAFRPREDVTA